MIDQVCGGFRHASSAAGRTEAAALAREGEQLVGTTAVASEAAEAVG